MLDPTVLTTNGRKSLYDRWAEAPPLRLPRREVAQPTDRVPTDRMVRPRPGRTMVGVYWPTSRNLLAY